MKDSLNTIRTLIPSKNLLLKTVLVAAQVCCSLASTLDHWDLVGTPSANDFSSVACQNGIYVAVTDQGSIFTSSTGSAWEHAFAPASGGSFNSVLGANGLFIAAGNAPLGSSHLYTSTDGKTWTRRESGITSSIRGLASGNGRYVGVGSGGFVIVSPDSVTWKSLRLSENLYEVTFGNGLFVAVGLQGSVFTSPDGSDWIRRATGTTRTLHGVAWGGGTFVAVGEGGVILRSRTGTHWDPSLSRSLGTLDLFDIQYNAGLFVAVGEDGFIACSRNLANWTLPGARTAQNLRDVVYSGRVFLAVGRDGATVRSRSYLDLERPAFTPEGRNFEIVAESGRTYTLEKTFDLKSWDTVVETVGNGTSIRLTDSAPSPRAFYRLGMR